MIKSMQQDDSQRLLSIKQSEFADAHHTDSLKHIIQSLISGISIFFAVTVIQHISS
jgi:hypothetical protein